MWTLPGHGRYLMAAATDDYVLLCFLFIDVPLMVYTVSDTAIVMHFKRPPGLRWYL